jgi:hypothetical protein
MNSTDKGQINHKSFSWFWFKNTCSKCILCFGGIKKKLPPINQAFSINMKSTFDQLDIFLINIRDLALAFVNLWIKKNATCTD